MTYMPHLRDLNWNSSSELVMTKGGLKACYQYSGGQRIRKVVEKDGFREERIYLGSYERYRKVNYLGNTLVARDTMHLADGTGRVAMLEVRIVGGGSDDDYTTGELKRFIYSNPLQSSNLELDEGGEVISYEEYHPYGTTAYQAVNDSIKATAKRYRFTGKERDEESGLNYHGARYYAPWLCRWIAVDPLEGKYAGWSAYQYCTCNPVMNTDSTGQGNDDKTVGVKAPVPNNDRTAEIMGYHVSTPLPNFTLTSSRVGASQIAADNGIQKPFVPNVDLTTIPRVSGLGEIFDNYINGISTGPDRATIGPVNNSEAFGGHLRSSPILAPLGYYLFGEKGAALGDAVGDAGMAVISTPGTPSGRVERPTEPAQELYTAKTEAPVSSNRTSSVQAEVSKSADGSLIYTLTTEQAKEVNNAYSITVIGRMSDLQAFNENPLVDSWIKSGTRNPSGKPITWFQNKAWLDERIARGDKFWLATDPASLPPVRGGYKPGEPNGYFTARELQ